MAPEMQVSKHWVENKPWWFDGPTVDKWNHHGIFLVSYWDIIDKSCLIGYDQGVNQRSCWLL